MNISIMQKTERAMEGQFAEIAFNYGIICSAINQDIDRFGCKEREISCLQVERLTS